jgi:hypothetical protein
LSLLRDVVGLLADHGIRHAVIGAAALAAHGVPRATADLDLLALDLACLAEALWEPLRSGASTEIRRGDADDPLAGVVRIRSKADATVDLVVGRGGWQVSVLARARPTRLADVSVPVVTAPDLVLLKLYAGGPRDAWDIDQLLDVDGAIAAAVEREIAALPRDARELWRRIREQRGEPGS